MQTYKFQPPQLAQQALIGGEFHLQRLGNLYLVRATPELDGKRLGCPLDFPRFAPQFSWAPVKRAQAIENRAPNSKLSITAELDLLRRVKLTECLEQTNYPRTEQVLYGKMSGKTRVNAPGNQPDEREVFNHQPLPVQVGLP
jgi:hypothetical protein